MNRWFSMQRWAIPILVVLYVVVMWFLIYMLPDPPPRKWYTCTLPSGQVVRVNWMDVSSEAWALSTGETLIKGYGNLICIEEGDNHGKR